MRNDAEVLSRISYILANSFYDIKYFKWSKENEKEFYVDIINNNGYFMIVINYEGSALVKVNSQPYYALDGYHNTFPLPEGKIRVNALFSPYKAFGQKVEINPGTPVIFRRNEDAYKLWAYLNATLQLAKNSQDYLREKLLKVLTETLSLVPFVSVSRDQLLLASKYWNDFPSHLLEFSQEMKYEEFHEGNYKEALTYLKEKLGELRETFGKAGELIGFAHAHMDTAWLWNFDETRRKVARTFSTVLNLMSKYDFQYIQSMALYYEWIKEDYPELFNKIKEKVKEGKWILGAGWVEFDANLPSGESIARQLLYSQEFYLSNFGKIAEILWLPDTFGFSAQLPQIMKLSGIKYFATHKVFWNDTNKFPYSVFNWIGIDGTSIPSIAFGNGKGGYNSEFTVDSVMSQWNNWKDKDQPMLYSYGYGDGGGGPTEDMLNFAEAINELPSLPKVKLTGGIPEYKPENSWSDELYVETHRGVYTSHSKMKYLHRRAECALRDAEIWSTIAGRYDKEIVNLWKILLKDEFHDVLPGSAINEVYKIVYPELEGIISKANKIIDESIKAIAGEGDRLIFFNSLSWDREDVAVVNEELPNSQKVDEGYLVIVKVPSVGYSEYKEVKYSPVKVDGLLMENDYLKVKLDENGSILSIFDKEENREIIKSPSKLIFYENIPGWADAWDIEKSYKDTYFEVKAYKYEIKERGPTRACIRFYYKFRNSEITQDVCLNANSRRIDFKTRTKIPDRELLLKAWYYFDLNSTEAVYEIPFGVIKRKTTASNSWELAKFEVPFIKWMDIYEDDYGVALLNDGKYGIAVERSNVGISLAKTPIYPDYETDSEENVFTYSIYPHKGNWISAEVYKRAYELNYPIRATKGKGGEKSFVSVNPRNIVLEALKPSEDGNGIVLRLYNVENNRGIGEIKLWKSPNTAYKTNILENEKLEDVNINKDEISFNYRNYEIISIKIE